MGKGHLWAEKCENCGHSKARHKKWFEIHFDGTEYISSFGRCLCKDCECTEFEELKSADFHGGTTNGNR